MRPDLGLTEDAAKKVVQRSNASDPRRMLSTLPDLVKACAQVAKFKAGDTRKTPQKHLFLPREFNGDPNAETFTPWAEQEVLEHLESGWGTEEVVDLEVQFLNEGEPEGSG